MGTFFPQRFKLVPVVLLVLALGCKHDIPVQPAKENSTQNPVDPNNPGNPNNPNNPGNPGNTNPCDPNKVYFQRDILPILLSNCAMSGCHNAASAQKGVILDSYGSVMNTADVRPGNANNSDLYEVLVENDPRKRMPYGGSPLPAAQRDLIRTWINQGATNEICSNSTCDSTNVTYNETIKPIIQTNCSGCHNSSLASGGYNFGTHAGLSVVVQNGKLVGAISHKPGYIAMPQGGTLSNCDIALIKKWVRGGAPNN